jgi:hypothetical protein
LVNSNCIGSVVAQDFIASAAASDPQRRVGTTPPPPPPLTVVVEEEEEEEGCEGRSVDDDILFGPFPPVGL